jgi:transposase InsO family protein
VEAAMGWKTMDVREQRVRFVVAALRRERSFSSLCREFEISRPTGRLWLERYRAGGVEAIAERSRRPLHSPRQTPPELEQRVVELRQRYPDWGARKLRVRLGAAGIELPASTIHRILLRHQLVEEQDRHRAALQRFERATPNELWQMDFKGPKSWHQPVGPLSVLDDHSRYVIALEALGSTQAGPVRARLEEAFVECGVPQSMLMDHGVPWWSWAGPKAATTGLALWLMKQGIRLCWSGIGHPQTQGKVERFHGALERALDKRGLSGHSPQLWLDDYRWEHNHLRPHEALGMQTPASRWSPSLRRYVGPALLDVFGELLQPINRSPGMISPGKIKTIRAMKPSENLLECSMPHCTHVCQRIPGERKNVVKSPLREIQV